MRFNKKNIRLNEDDLHTVIDRSLRRMINEGFISHDGNGMVGGSYGSKELNATISIFTDLEYALDNNGGTEEDMDYLYEHEDDFVINVTVSESYDNSVGIDYSFEIEDVNEDDINRIKDIIENLPSDDEGLIEAMINAVDEAVDNISEKDADSFNVEYEDTFEDYE